MEALAYIIAYVIVGLLIIPGIAWLVFGFVALVVGTKRDADAGNLTWVHGAFWSCIGTCLLVGMIRGCQ